MTAVILQLRDYKTKDDREAEINRACLAAVSEALGDAQPMYPAGAGSFTASECLALEAHAIRLWQSSLDTAPSEYIAPDGDCA